MIQLCIENKDLRTRLILKKSLIISYASFIMKNDPKIVRTAHEKIANTSHLFNLNKYD